MRCPRAALDGLLLHLLPQRGDYPMVGDEAGRRQGSAGRRLLRLFFHDCLTARFF
jgi:hypothetical protein